MAGYEDTLRKLTIRDDEFVEAILAHEDDLPCSALDPKTQALVRLGALIAIDAAPPSYMRSVEASLRHGATKDEIVGTLIAVMPAIGTGRVVSAAPKLGLALDYDVVAALERLDAVHLAPVSDDALDEPGA